MEIWIDGPFFVVVAFWIFIHFRSLFMNCFQSLFRFAFFFSSDVFQCNWSSVVTVFGIKSVPRCNWWLMAYGWLQCSVYDTYQVSAEMGREFIHMDRIMGKWELNSNQRWNGWEIFKFQIVTGHIWCTNEDEELGTQYLLGTQYSTMQWMKKKNIQSFHSISTNNNLTIF